MMISTRVCTHMQNSTRTMQDEKAPTFIRQHICIMHAAILALDYGGAHIRCNGLYRALHFIIHQHKIGGIARLDVPEKKVAHTHLTEESIDIEIIIKLRCFGDESFWKVLPQTYPYYKKNPAGLQYILCQFIKCPLVALFLCNMDYIRRVKEHF